MFYYDYVYFVGNVWTWTNESFRLIKGDTVFDVVNWDIVFVNGLLLFIESGF